MKVPLQVHVKNIKHEDFIYDLIKEKVEKLHEVCSYMISCDIAIEKNQAHQRSGQGYRVRLVITVPPGHELVVKRESGEGNLHEPLNAIIREAFEAAKRKLKKLTDLQRGEMKRHESLQANGIVSKIFKKENYGFIRSNDNREIYFHANSILHNDFSLLKIGDGVRYMEHLGEKGPQASSVEVVAKPNL